MFLFEKYRPKLYTELLFNKEVFSQLLHISTYEDIPHLIISGPPGSGKKILLRIFLEAIYDSDVNILVRRKYNIKGSSSKKEIEIMQSNYHIMIEPTNTNHDKYILQEIIKQYAMVKSFVFRTQRKFKTIVIYNLENIALNSQSALRRTMEIYAKTCRFIMICNNLSRVFEPLRSRVRTFCVPLPNQTQIYKVIRHIAIMEKISLSRRDAKIILKNCDNSLKKAIWMLDAKRLKIDPKISMNYIFDKVVELILNSPKRKDIIKVFADQIRNHLYNILITNIKGSDIIINILNKILERIHDTKVNINIIRYASDAEYNLIHGRHNIININYFITGVIKELFIHHQK